MRRIPVTVLIFLFLYAGPTIGQQPLHYSFTHYTTASGLISDQVNTVIQDDDGFIWTGSTDGLQRFDGTRYKTFRHKENNSTTIPSNPVWQLFLDKKKNLWVMLADGKLGIFDTKRFVFKESGVKLRDPASINSSIKRLISDQSGHLFYLLGGNEVLTWDEKTNVFSYLYNFFKEKKGAKPADFIHQPGTQKYWMSLESGGFSVYNNATGNLSFTGNNIEKEPIIEQYKNLNPVYHLFFDNKDRLWFIEWLNQGFPVVHSFDGRLNKPVVTSADLNSYLKTYHEIRGFFQQKDGSVWVKGLEVFAKYIESEKIFKPVYNGYLSDKSIAYEAVHCLYEDREENIWVATSDNGLYRFNPGNEFFTNINHENRATGKPGKGTVLSFMPTRWGTTLAGTWGDGLYHYDKDFNLIPTNIKGIDNIERAFMWSMFASPDSNTIWMSSQPGIYRLDQLSRSAKFYNPPALENRTIRQIVEDKKGNLWLGMQSIGVFKWTKEKGKNKFNNGMFAFTAIPRVMINRIKVDTRGNIWIATSGQGLYVIDPATDSIILHFHNKAEREMKLPEPIVKDILEYDDSTMIIATSTRIIRYNRLSGTSSYLGTSDIISGFTATMEKDNAGYLWLTTTTGLYRINVLKKIFVQFNRRDGIANDHFTIGASQVMADGRMLFGSSTNFIVFNPASIKITATSPQINITGFKLMNKSLSVDSLIQLKEIQLNYEDNSLLVEFSTFNFTNAVLVKYKLEGLDKDWKIADKNNEAIYSYLPPGSYTLLLKTMDEEGNESKQMTRLSIKVKYPFWQTWWFYSLLALVIGGLLFWFDRERMRRKEALQKMRSDIADDLHHDINTALGNINILSEMARLKADKEPQKSLEFIEQIHSKSHNMMIAIDDMLWNISPDNDSMGNFILRFTEYIEALKNRHAVQIDFLIDKNVESVQLNMKLRKEVYWMFKGGISNVVKTGGTNCHIHITYVKPILNYTLGFDSEHLNFVQFNNLRQRKELADKLESLKAKLDLEVHKTKTIMMLRIPVV